MPDKSNDTGSRMKHATGQGFAHNVPERNAFGTPDEIQARVGGSFQSLPDNKPTNFKQLGPQSTGNSMGSARPTRRSGNQKFGDPGAYGA